MPAGVGLMNCLGLIADEWIPIVGAAVGSTVVIIAVTGWMHRLVRKSMARKHTGIRINENSIEKETEAL